MSFIKRKLFICLLGLISIVILGNPDLSSAQANHLIVIDPAHGGQDTGVKISDKIGEKDVTLALALAIQKEFAGDDKYKIILTRDSDREISLEDRRKDISKAKPDILLTLHINAGFGKSAAGFEIYYPGFKDLEEQKKKVKKDSKDARYKYLNESVRLAQIIQKNLDTLFPRKGRGLREADLPILEGMNVAAVAVELGFATNPEERKKLLSEKTQSEIAKSLSKSIKSFFK